MMLDQKLKDYAREDIYPFHMPGHKRVALDDWNPYITDITEIEGFDNLHQAKGILLTAQQKAAKVYGSKEAFYLINGSTCGILAAISATVKKGGTILVARNCHKAVYNGILLRELNTIYAYPEITECGIQGQITVENLEALILENPEIEAVLITSPTYDGVVSDIEGIAKMVHSYNLPLIVDAAHGAHLGFVSSFPSNPIQLGADVVIESVHKTLPAFTQTALLHLCSSRVSANKIRRYLGIYETSSPSYILMAGIERCIEYLEQRGSSDLEKLAERLKTFYQRTKNLVNIKVLQASDLKKEEAYAFDPSKILIFSKNKYVTGNDIYQILLDKYHIQMEMVSGQYVLALSSVMDTEEGFERLILALEEMDQSPIFSESREATSGKVTYPKLNAILPIHKVEELDMEEVLLEESAGKLAGEYLYLYPPGIPLIVPGEEITEEFIMRIREYQQKGLSVTGLPSEELICIVNFS